MFNIDLKPMALTDEEKRRFEERLPYFRSKEWVHMVEPKTHGQKTVRAACKFNSGMVGFTLVTHGNGKQVKDILITGDFLSFPSRGIYDLMAELKGSFLDRDHIRQTIKKYFVRFLELLIAPHYIYYLKKLKSIQFRFSLIMG